MTAERVYLQKSAPEGFVFCLRLGQKTAVPERTAAKWEIMIKSDKAPKTTAAALLLRPPASQRSADLVTICVLRPFVTIRKHGHLKESAEKQIYLDS
ncbi:hypothetical protein AVEN_261683-1 [Araneus ventricosus]|uniref:Uncharacterized protein n=1 Tax=Araneus ventricosus TaxID=182803 RepID=A0A4Y2DY68_ARAVE|nr:hypothetical protein AVEN_261683-1 [Araneus ventricosus]